MKLRCIIIDDEVLARKYLKDYISKVPFLELIGDYNSPLKAYELIEKEMVDLIFLDIQMPWISGIDFVRSLEKKPHIVLTTAYSEYAVEGYELDITDYLLKPISFERFLMSVDKVNRLVSKEHGIELPKISKIRHDFYDDYIIVRADRKHYKINYDDLIYVEGQKAYVTFHSIGKKRVTALASLKDLVEKLPESKFIRVHKSYIVSIQHVSSIEGNTIEINGEKVPIGKSFKTQLLDFFGME